MLRKDGRFFSIHTDHLGSVQAIVDDTGEIADQYSYTEFGETKAFNKDGIEVDISNTVTSNIFGFTGRELDSESEFYYYRARYYSPSLGRFISEDPIGFNGNDFNVYRYVNNKPLIFKDPSGEISVFSVGACLAALGAGTVIDAVNSFNDVQSRVDEANARIDDLREERKTCSASRKIEIDLEIQEITKSVQQDSMVDTISAILPGPATIAAVGVCVVSLATF